VSQPSKVIYVVHKSLTEPIPRLHGLAQVHALAGARRFAVLSFEPRSSTRSEADRALYRETREWLLAAGVEHTGLPFLGSRWLEIPLGALVLLWKILFRGVRIVHCRSYIAGLMGLLVRPVTPSRFLFDPRGLFVDEYLYQGAFREGTPRLRFARWLERRLYATADLVAVMSRKFGDHLLGRDDLADVLPPHKVRLIPNRVVVARFREAARDRDRTRRERGWEGKLVAAYVASRSRWHRLDSAFAILREVASAVSSLRLIIATYPSTDEARALAAQAGFPEDRAEFLTVPVAEIPGLLAASDVSLMLEARHLIREVCAPIKFSEYIAAGLPVIASPGIGDVSEWIDEDELGILVEPAEIGESAARVIDFLRSDALLNGDVRRRCLEFAEREMDMDKTLEEYEAAYRALDGT